ncbi:MAG: hypothetical protein HXY34_08755 [Candidatus Thorarchaeota archaeon]|nr:hypothetical protein [Candidatus Thorarchaeota archaeon]
MRTNIWPYLSPIVDFIESTPLVWSLMEVGIVVSIVMGGLAFMLYEGRAALRVLSGSLASLAASAQQPTALQTPSVRPTTSPSARFPRETVKREVVPQRQHHEVTHAGVKVIATMQAHGDTHTLKTMVTNQNDYRIEMVVVTIDPPDGVEPAIGSFRMQRLGTINPGSTQVAQFSMRSLGGNVMDVSGQIEFISANYEITKIDLPVPRQE